MEDCGGRDVELAVGPCNDSGRATEEEVIIVGSIGGGCIGRREDDVGCRKVKPPVTTAVDAKLLLLLPRGE